MSAREKELEKILRDGVNGFGKIIVASVASFNVEPVSEWLARARKILAGTREERRTFKRRNHEDRRSK